MGLAMVSPPRPRMLARVGMAVLLKKRRPAVHGGRRGATRLRVDLGVGRRALAAAHRRLAIVARRPAQADTAGVIGRIRGAQLEAGGQLVRMRTPGDGMAVYGQRLR